jgi:uncharacterized protein YndB with AHSA1/START domain
MSEVAREVVLPAPPARVWEALSDPEKLSGWFGAEASIEVRSRGRARFRWPDGTERNAVVETVEAPRLLVFRWLPFERIGRGATRPAVPGRVRIALEPHEGGTLLTVVESAPSAGADDTSQPGASPGTTLLLERPQPAPPGPPIRARSP